MPDYWIGSDNLRNRYVFGPPADELLVRYEGTGAATRRWLHADERGSIIAVSGSTGASTQKNSYDVYGTPASTNQGRFQYTGQMWIPELGLYHYKARIYSPTLGRFLQADPIGYADGMNLYANVGNDPTNRIDPLGLRDFNNLRPHEPVMFDNGWQPPVYADGKQYNHFDPTLDNLVFRNNQALLNPSYGADGYASIATPVAPAGPGATGTENICSIPLSGAANRGQTVNSRRTQVRHEIRQAMDMAARTNVSGGAAYSAQVGRNIARPAPNWGTWIKGGTSRADGNYLYGAITAELGIPLSVALTFGDVAEFVDDIWDRAIPSGQPDEGIGGDSQEAKDQVTAGARCPG